MVGKSPNTPGDKVYAGAYQPTHITALRSVEGPTQNRGFKI